MEPIKAVVVFLLIFGGIMLACLFTANSVNSYRDALETIPKSPAKAWTLYQEAVDYENEIVAQERERHNIATGVQKNP